MRPFCMTMVTPLCGAAPEPSITVALVSAVTCAAALPAKHKAAAIAAAVTDRIVCSLLHAANQTLRTIAGVRCLIVGAPICWIMA